MTAPTLRDIFDVLEYPGNVTPEYRELERSLNKALNSHIEQNEAEEVYAYIADLVSEAQYLGFVQGFDLARTLICGKLL